MHIGKGTLELRSGRTLTLEYQFGSDYGDTRAGYLLCDASSFDPEEFCHRLVLKCDDGTEVVLAVMYSSDRHLAVTGRVRASEDVAA
jgi:hypothetical protein